MMGGSSECRKSIPEEMLIAIFNLKWIEIYSSEEYNNLLKSG